MGENAALSVASAAWRHGAVRVAVATWRRAVLASAVALAMGARAIGVGAKEARATSTMPQQIYFPSIQI